MPRAGRDPRKRVCAFLPPSILFQRLAEQVFGAVDLDEHGPTLLLGIGFLLGLDQPLPHLVVDGSRFVDARGAVEPRQPADGQHGFGAEVEIEHRHVGAVAQQRRRAAAAALPDRDVLVIIDLRAAARRDLREAVLEHGADQAGMLGESAVDQGPDSLWDHGHGYRLAIGVVGGVVAAEPFLELGMGLFAARRVDLARLGRVERELDDHAVRVGRLDGAAIAVLEHEMSGLLVSGLLEPLLDALLGLGVDVERDVMERRERHLGAELLLVLRLLELEEGGRAAVAEPEEAVAIGAHRAEQLVGLAPGRDQRQADHVLIEFARRLHILGDVGGVMQAAGKRHVQFLQNFFDASAAPSASALSLAQTTSGSTPPWPTWMEKPQSTPAITFSGPSTPA